MERENWVDVGVIGFVMVEADMAMDELGIEDGGGMAEEGTLIPSLMFLRFADESPIVASSGLSRFSVVGAGTALALVRGLEMGVVPSMLLGPGI